MARYNETVSNQTTMITLAGWVLLVFSVSAISLLIVWQLLRTLRRHDHRCQPTPKRRRPRSDIWQASGDRLGPPIITQHDDDPN